MKIAVTATKPDLEGDIDPRFGRSKYFLIVDTDTLQFEAVENPNTSAGSGAGIRSAELVGKKGVEAVITGSCGPNAFRTLNAAGLKVVTGGSGSIKDAVENFKAGRYETADGANVPGHSGMSVANSAGDKEETMPRGTGRGAGGQGQGSGKGMGRGRGGGYALGPGGNCVCPSCGKTVSHQQGMPCYEVKCPSCGAPMTRQR